MNIRKLRTIVDGLTERERGRGYIVPPAHIQTLLDAVPKLLEIAEAVRDLTDALKELDEAVGGDVGSAT